MVAEHSTTRICLKLAYQGTGFHGWQVQDKHRTVQGCLEESIFSLTKQRIRVHGAGRTDAGVHATGQVAHFDIPTPVTIPWQQALNALLPSDIAVVQALERDLEFHARYSALFKEYTYTLWTDPSYLLPQRRHFVWPVYGLDLKRMQSAADKLLGKHDFACFQNVGTDISSTIRTMHRIGFAEHKHLPELYMTFTADGFLKQMVRNIVGALVHVGQERMAPEAIRDLLQEKDRTKAPKTAPPQGLNLDRVGYQGDDWHH